MLSKKPPECNIALLPSNPSPLPRGAQSNQVKVAILQHIFTQVRVKKYLVTSLLKY